MDKRYLPHVEVRSDEYNVGFVTRTIFMVPQCEISDGTDLADWLLRAQVMVEKFYAVRDIMRQAQSEVEEHLPPEESA